MYDLTFGPHEAQIAAAAEEMGQELPDTLADKPEVRPDLWLYWEAYLDLTGTRAIGFGLGPIPWTAVDGFAGRHGLDDPDEFQTLKEIVWGVDRAYLKWHADNKDKKG